MFLLITAIGIVGVFLGALLGYSIGYQAGKEDCSKTLMDLALNSENKEEFQELIGLSKKL